MRRTAPFILACCIAIALGYDAQAQGKKKGKEPELAICKRGKLIFEDDFSGKELDWLPLRGEWKIVKKTLVTVSNSSDVAQASKSLSIRRPFEPTANVIVEFRILIPLQSLCSIITGPGQLPSSPVAIIDTGGQKVCFLYVQDEKAEEVATGPLSYQKPRWLTVLLEEYARRLSLTVDNKTICYEISAPEVDKRSQFKIDFRKPNREVLAVDDVKVYEALPKDEGEEKDEKGKKKK